MALNPPQTSIAIPDPEPRTKYVVIRLIQMMLWRRSLKSSVMGVIEEIRSRKMDTPKINRGRLDKNRARALPTSNIRPKPKI
jgi:hypothetical protein